LQGRGPKVENASAAFATGLSLSLSGKVSNGRVEDIAIKRAIQNTVEIGERALAEAAAILSGPDHGCIVG
jgi:hypothetical protein